MPVAAEHRASMGSEHSLKPIWSSNVPQLNVAIFKRCSKREIILVAELNIPHTL